MLKLINRNDGTIIQSQRHNGEVEITITNPGGTALTYDLQTAKEVCILLGTIIEAEESNNKFLNQ